MSAPSRSTKQELRARSSARKAATLDYVHQMLRELNQMMEAEGELFITYLIGMAYTATGDLIRKRYANAAAALQNEMKAGTPAPKSKTGT